MKEKSRKRRRKGKGKEKDEGARWSYWANVARSPNFLLYLCDSRLTASLVFPGLAHVWVDQHVTINDNDDRMCTA